MWKRGAYLKFPALCSIPRKTRFFSPESAKVERGHFRCWKRRGGGGSQGAIVPEKDRGGESYSVSGLQCSREEGGGDHY